MSRAIFKFIKDTGPEDWAALSQAYKAGDVVYEFTGHDYGIVRDDLMYLGVHCIACTDNENGEGPFFTVPVNLLYNEAGKNPECPYTRFGGL